MMKVAYCSDLHLEFGDIDLKNTVYAIVTGKQIGRAHV